MLSHTVNYGMTAAARTRKVKGKKHSYASLQRGSQALALHPFAHKGQGHRDSVATSIPAWKEGTLT